jgi:hypothetical protein
VLHCADRATTWISDQSRLKGELVSHFSGFNKG